MEVALVILDGWGVGSHDRRDAVRAAQTPTFDGYQRAGASGTLRAHGRSVGLPPGSMGNSEVGHLTIGAGRVVRQSRTRISDAIQDGSFAENPVLVSVFEECGRNNRVHLAGLLSDAGVHADDAHVHALLELGAEYGAELVSHVFTDGRDTAPTAAATYLERLERVVGSVGTGRVATVTGRYYAMDRDERWDRTRRAYEAMVNRDAEFVADSARGAVERAYDRGESDEFIQPTIIQGGPAIEEDDRVVCWNFRADRMRQLVRMLAGIDPAWPFETAPPGVEVVSMTEYDSTFDLRVAFSAEVPENTLGWVLAGAGKTQLRIAETEKYAHVTYFLNGGREVEFDGEVRAIVPSPDVATYDSCPEMSAVEVTDRAIAIIDEQDPDVLVLNYANPDMVGHTGDFAATVRAVETVDRELGRLVPAVQARGGAVVVSADHGNADDMGTREAPWTAHTINPVPVVFLAADGSDGGYRVRDGGGLEDLAPTLLWVMGLEQPEEMAGRPLLEAE